MIAGIHTEWLRGIRPKALKYPLRSAIVGVLATLVAGEVGGTHAPWSVGLWLGTVHYLCERLLRWLYRN